MPVVEKRPPVTARPCSWVAASNWPQVAPPPARTMLVAGSTSTWFIASQVDHEAVVADAVADGRVPTAAHGEQKLVVAGEVDGRDDIVDGLAAGDERRVAVVHAVPDLTGVVVARVSLPQELTGELRGQLLDLNALELVGH